MIKKLNPNLYQITFRRFGSCVYLRKIEDEWIVFDTGTRWNRSELKKDLEELNIKPEEVKKVILTHNHFDHTGNISIFKNAEVYGSVIDFKEKKLNKPFLGFLAEGIEETNDVDPKKIIPLEKLKVKAMEIIETPGHTKGGVCFYFPKDKILISGDTIFGRGIIGRTDLPNSEPEKMQDSLDKLEKLDVEVLCAGHV
ncbi:MBL fold metallo-hydrolase [Nanoarchaeota archaeon]